eukprot:4087400-Prymnesium_polylepis.1
MSAPPSAPTPLEDTLTSPTATPPRSAFQPRRSCKTLRGTHRRQEDTLACRGSPVAASGSASAPPATAFSG